MESFTARYVDGDVAIARPVLVRFDPPKLAGCVQIEDAETGAALDAWPVEALFSVPTPKGHLRIGARGRPYGARLAFAGDETIAAVRQLLPHLSRQRSLDRKRQLRLIGMATAALASAVAAYVYGVPLVAANITAALPPEWESRLGDTVATQIEAALATGAGFRLCDPDPSSVANQAIRRFADSAMAGTGSPFTAQVAVVQSSIPNAFALPGGRAYYFSALLDKTETADEFAGVLAHELGHVVHRHGMETLIATSATGLLIGFILGDMTGLSIAGALGAALIDNRFSREAERQADRFSAEVANRLGFEPVGLATLLERVEQEHSMDGAGALLSTHPLTAERRIALEAMSRPDPSLPPAFDAIEWAAIKAMCGTARPAGVPSAPPAAAVP